MNLHCRKEYEDREAQCVAEEYEFLGWANGWGETPEKQVKCREQDHKRFDVQGNDSGSANIQGCETCKIYSKYDCSG